MIHQIVTIEDLKPGDIVLGMRFAELRSGEIDSFYEWSNNHNTVYMYLNSYIHNADMHLNFLVTLNGCFSRIHHSTWYVSAERNHINGYHCYCKILRVI